MKKSTIYIKKMDCPSEIKMIESLFENLDSSIKINFNLSSRECEVYHNNKFEITDKYLRITEKNIKEQPENYLWSHKRFKHQNRYDEWKELFSKKQKEKKK